MRRSLRDLVRNPFVVLPVVAVLLLALFGAWWFGFRSDGSAGAASSTRQVVTATTGDMARTVSADGTVAAAQTDDLSFSSSGTVTAVNVKAGDEVTAGQVLASIDSAELEAAVSSAQSSLADAQATLSDAQSSGASSAQISADQTKVSTAEDSLATAQSALDGASLVATFDGTVATVDLTVGEELGNGGTGGTTATGSASGSGQSSSTLGSSSSSGLGGSGSTGSNGSSSSSSAQIQVVSASRYTVQVSVDSSDIGEVAVGQSATVAITTSSSGSGRFGGGAFRGFAGGNFPGFGNATGNANGNDGSNGNGSGNASSSRSGTTTTGTGVSGTVTEVGQVADASSGVASYPVTVSFTTDDAQFTVGSSVSASITVSQRKDVVQVPVLAVTTTNGASTVLVATDGTADGATETRTVETGERQDGMVEITSGLKSGEKVIVSTAFPGAAPGGSGSGSSGGFTPPEGFSPPSGAVTGGRG